MSKKVSSLIFAICFLFLFSNIFTVPKASAQITLDNKNIGTNYEVTTDLSLKSLKISGKNKNTLSELTIKGYDTELILNGSFNGAYAKISILEGSIFSTEGTFTLSKSSEIQVSGYGVNNLASNIRINTLNADNSIMEALDGGSIDINLVSLKNSAYIKSIGISDTGKPSVVNLNQVNLNNHSELMASYGGEIYITQKTVADKYSQIYAEVYAGKIFLQDVQLSNNSKLYAEGGGSVKAEYVEVTTTSMIYAHGHYWENFEPSKVFLKKVKMNKTTLSARYTGLIVVEDLLTAENDSVIYAEGPSSSNLDPARLELGKVTLNKSQIYAEKYGAINIDELEMSSKSSLSSDNSTIEVGKLTIKDSEILSKEGAKIHFSDQILSYKSTITVSGLNKYSYENSMISADEITLSNSKINTLNGGILTAKKLLANDKSEIYIYIEKSIYEDAKKDPNLTYKPVIVNNSTEDLFRDIQNIIQVNEHNAKVRVAQNTEASIAYIESFELDSSKLEINSGGEFYGTELILKNDSVLNLKAGRAVTERLIADESIINVDERASLIIKDLILQQSTINLSGIFEGHIFIASSDASVLGVGKIFGYVKNSGVFSGKVNVTGDYLQNNGTLLILISNTGKIEAFYVDGKIILGEASIVFIENKSNFVPVNGEKYIIVQSSQKIEGEFSEVKLNTKILGYEMEIGLTEDKCGIWLRWIK